MDDYRVAAYPGLRGRQSTGDAPEGKHHAYRPDAQTTVCGFGLIQMQRFANLLFTDQPPPVRCSICDQRVRAAGR